MAAAMSLCIQAEQILYVVSCQQAALTICRAEMGFARNLGMGT